jgi:hypothetical protein
MNIVINNFQSSLTAPLGITDTQMFIAGVLPALTNGNTYTLTLYERDGAEEVAWEIVKVTAVEGSTLTVVRGQEGTTARAWSVGTRVEMRLTAGGFLDGLNSKVDKLSAGIANGIATLDENAKVPSEQLPSYANEMLADFTVQTCRNALTWYINDVLTVFKRDTSVGVSSVVAAHPATASILPPTLPDEVGAFIASLDLGATPENTQAAIATFVASKCVLATASGGSTGTGDNTGSGETNTGGSGPYLDGGTF